MNYLEQKYIGLLSGRLRNFKRKSSNIFNFSCPICHDSTKVKSKARGYIYDKGGKGFYHCHNCGFSSSLPIFIKTVDQNLYNEFMLEKVADEKPQEQKDFEAFVDKMRKPFFLTSGPLKGLKKVSQLSPNDPVKKFVDKRKLPNPYHAKLFACPNFKNYTNNFLIPDKFSKESLLRDETRLLIPYFDKNKNLHAMNFRALGESKVKYIKILLNEEIPNVYGLDTVEFGKTTYVFEGEFDSMFIPNSIATGGGDLVAAVRTFPKHNLTIVLDNEPRSKETVKKLDKAIKNGYYVVIWPENLDYKDVNDMVLGGLSPEFIEHILKHNTYKDLAAHLALQKWKKI